MQIDETKMSKITKTVEGESRSGIGPIKSMLYSFNRKLPTFNDYQEYKKKNKKKCIF